MKETWTNEHEGKELCKMALVRDPEGNLVMLHQISASFFIIVTAHGNVCEWGRYGAVDTPS